MDDGELRDRLDALEDRLEAKIEKVHEIVKNEYTLLELWRRTDRQLQWLFTSVGGLIFAILATGVGILLFGSGSQ